MSDIDDDSAPQSPDRGRGDRPDGGRDGRRESDGDRTENLRLSVPEMDCATCAEKVESSLAESPGVSEYETRPTAGTVTVSYDPATGSSDEVVDAVESAGYGVEDATGGGESGPSLPDRADVWTSPRAIKTWIGAVFLAAGLVLEFLVPGQYTLVAVGPRAFHVADAFLLVAAATAGAEILRGGYYSARNRQLDIDFLMSVAILSAVTASVVAPGTRLYSEAATLAVLFSVAELLEHYSMDRARDSMRELVDLSPEEATVLRPADDADRPTDGDPGSVATEAVTVPADELRVGDLVVVRPGEKVPADGVVREGDSAVDESPITGESVPAEKAVGDEVYAGTINEEGYLEVEVTAPAGQDTLSRIVELVEAARDAKTDREQFVDRFAGYYTPLMVAVAVLVAAVPPLALGDDPVRWFVAGITMLVLACPCAFVISTPVSVVSGITSAAKHGVLIKGGDRLEAMGEVDAVAMDKTGTLTEGELSVTDVVPLNDATEAEVLRCARGLEQRSEHPIGKAIVGEAAAAAIEAGTVEDFESLTGEGVRATLDGIPHYAGKPDLFDDLGFDLSHAHVLPEVADGRLGEEVRDVCERSGCLDLAAETIPRLQAEGKTVVLVGTDEELEGLVAVADDVRPEARWTVQRLRDLGVTTVMLTGDNAGTARAIGDRVGVDDVRAELLPEDKVAAVEELQAGYGEVAMVGDGINDAPALATADVGIAMGAAGTDTAIETADVALMGDDVSKLPYLYQLSNRANGVIRQNIWGSLAAKAVLAVGVPLGYVSVALAVLVGDAGMTLGVTGNAMRLSKIAPEEPDR